MNFQLKQFTYTIKRMSKSEFRYQDIQKQNTFIKYLNAVSQLFSPTNLIKVPFVFTVSTININ